MASAAYELKQEFKKEYGTLARVIDLINFTGMSRDTIDRALEESGITPITRRKRTRYYFYKDAIDAVLGRTSQ